MTEQQREYKGHILPLTVDKTEQQVFDKVATHLLTQRACSLMSEEDKARLHENPASTAAICAYRGKNGLKCAVGVLIPDEVYADNMEQVRVSGLRRMDGITGPLFAEEHLSLLTMLQNAHDDNAKIDGPVDFTLQLYRVAEMYDLSTAVLDNWEKKCD